MRVQLVCGLLLIFLCGTAIAAEREQVGIVERIQNDAFAVFAGEQRTLITQSVVYFGDELQTGANARLAVMLQDGTELTLGADGRLVIDEFVYQPQAQTGKLALNIVQGAFLFIGGKVESQADADVSVTTPVGTLGIRGTTFWGGVLDGVFGVLTLNGEVVVSNSAGTVTLTSGMGTSVASADRAPTEPKRWPEAKTRRAVDTILFAGR